jgi:uncharacterized protein YheU (UPF0270 family)
MIIPHTALSSEILRAVIEEFVSREGTEYGANEIALETKIGQVYKQLDRGDIVLVYDEPSDTCDLVSKTSARYQKLLLASAEG